ncbi:MAG: glutathione S-transferase family protein [Candidatus Puniceispirillaceae bacterium]|jgi:glutathione S-transferase
MILYSAPASPFGRMVKLTAWCLGQVDDLEVRATNTGDPDDGIREVNPLGKIPALVVAGQGGGDASTLYDSRVIVEYLDSLAGGGHVIPASGMARFEVLTRMARMVGVLDAAILVVYEARFRPADMRVESFVDYQRGKIIRVLETAGSPVYQNGAMPDAGEITLACALDYLDFRQQVNWRDHAPQLQDWLAGFAGAVPGYEATMPRD